MTALFFLLLSCARDRWQTVQVATNEQDAQRNCDVVDILTQEHCGADDERFDVECGYFDVDLDGGEDSCAYQSCESAMQVASWQCESSGGVWIHDNDWLVDCVDERGTGLYVFACGQGPYGG